jgi:cell division transport system permease protein
MFWVNLKRIIRSGFFGFLRNGFVSLSSVLVMIVTLFAIASILFTSAFLSFTLEWLKDKVDIRVTFIVEAGEEEVLDIQRILEEFPEVKSAVYSSREDELNKFVERYKNDQASLQALEEIGENPFGAAINIKAENPGQYEGTANFLESSNFLSKDGLPIIDGINFDRNQNAIDRLSDIISTTERLSFIIALILVVISILITLNTIRLAIYISKDEISVMKLVGASPIYIKGPFVVAGILYGVFASVVTAVILFPVTFWLSVSTERFLAEIGFIFYDYYLSNFGQIFLIILLAGIVIGAISSYLAAHRYLRN